MYASWIVFFYLTLALPVLLVSWCFSEPHLGMLAQNIMVMGVCLAVLLLLVHRFFRGRTLLSDGYHYFMLVFLWFGAALLAACIFRMYPHAIGWDDAIFASVSGLTTTGLEVFQKLSRLPASLLFYRMWLQFIGGLGIILMTITAFSSGGFSVTRGVKLDLPGPVVSYSKKKPKMSDIARYLWFIYFIATVLCGVSMKVLGLSWFEAFCESLSIVSTGGFSLYDAGVAHYQSVGVKFLMMMFMLFGSINFLLHYQFFVLREYQGYRLSSELRGYLQLLCTMCAFYVVALLIAGTVPFEDALFMVISLSTSSGYVVGDILSYPGFLPYLLILLGMVGGCAGSTSGGIKMIRLQFFFQEAVRACRLLIHPRVVLPDPASVVGMSGSSVDNQTVVLRGFFSIFIGYFTLSLLVLTGLGLDFQSAFFAICASLSNTGVFLTASQGAVGLSASVKSWLALTMLIGRIEILAFFVVLSPHYWTER